MRVRALYLFFLLMVMAGLSTCGGNVLTTSTFTTTTNADNSHNGVMFDVTASRSLVVRQFSIIPDGVYTNVYIEIWSLIGGVSTNAGGWVLAGSCTMDLPSVDLTLVPITVDIPISGGDTVGFYITTTNESIGYQNSLSVDFSCADLTVIADGYGVAYPFGSGFFTPRSFCGSIHYTVN